MLNKQAKVKLQELIVLFKTNGAGNNSVVLTQISYLLFLRFISNLSRNVINNVKVPGLDSKFFINKIRWDHFSKEMTEEQYELYRKYSVTRVLPIS